MTRNIYFISFVLIIQYVSWSLGKPSTTDKNAQSQASLGTAIDSDNLSNSMQNNETTYADDIFKRIDELEKSVEDLYQKAITNLKSWSLNQVLSKFENKAKEGLTIAKNQLNEITDESRSSIKKAINEAKNTMQPEELQKYVNNLQKIVYIETGPVLQNFQDALNAITSVGEQIDSKDTTELPTTVDNLNDRNMKSSDYGAPKNKSEEKKRINKQNIRRQQ